MAKRIGCSDLGIENCDFTAGGETPEDVMEEMTDHLRRKHDIDLPDTDVILAGDMTDDPLGSVGPEVALTIRRLREVLDIDPTIYPSPTVNPGVRPVDGSISNQT